MVQDGRLALRSATSSPACGCITPRPTLEDEETPRLDDRGARLNPYSLPAGGSPATHLNVDGSARAPEAAARPRSTRSRIRVTAAYLVAAAAAL